MKRYAAIFFAMLMAVLPMAFAGAEETENGTYLTSITNDDGVDVYDVYLMNLSEDTALSYDKEVSDAGMYTIEKPGMTAVRLFISKCDIQGAENISLADVDETSMEQVKAMAGEMYENPTFELLTTPAGNQYLHVCSNEESDIDHIFTLYKGAIIELLQYRDDFSKLSEEDESFMLDILHGIEFMDASAQ